MVKNFIVKISPNLHKYYIFIMVFCMVMMYFTFNVYAADDLWAVANKLILDIYNKIVGISTVLAALMSSIAVLGAKMSNNQHKVDQAWDWCATLITV